SRAQPLAGHSEGDEGEQVPGEVAPGPVGPVPGEEPPRLAAGDRGPVVFEPGGGPGHQGDGEGEPGQEERGAGEVPLPGTVARPPAGPAGPRRREPRRRRPSSPTTLIAPASPAPRGSKAPPPRLWPPTDGAGWLNIGCT